MLGPVRREGNGISGGLSLGGLWARNGKCRDYESGDERHNSCLRVNDRVNDGERQGYRTLRAGAIASNDVVAFDHCCYSDRFVVVVGLFIHADHAPVGADEYFRSSCDFGR